VITDTSFPIVDWAIAFGLEYQFLNSKEYIKNFVEKIILCNFAAQIITTYNLRK